MGQWFRFAMHIAFAVVFTGLVAAATGSNKWVAGGAFEGGSLTGWTQTAYTYGGRSIDLPLSQGDLLLQETIGTQPLIYGISGNAQSQATFGNPINPNSNVAVPMVPFDGSGCAGINLGSSGGVAASLSTEFPFDLDDVHSDDGRLRVHLRGLPTFLLAGTYTARTEPFVFISIDNLTRNQNGIASYYLGQADANGLAGVWYKSSRGDGTIVSASYWTDIHLLVPLTAAEPNDQLRLTALASGCATSAATGTSNQGAQLYIDTVAAAPNTLMMEALVPDVVPIGANYNLVIDVTHGSHDTANAALSVLVPTQSAPLLARSDSGWTCQTNLFSRVVNCQAPMLPAGGRSTVTLRLQANVGAGAMPLTTYNLLADGLPPQVGARVSTQAVLASSVSNVYVRSGIDQLGGPGEPTTLYLDANNDGAAAALGVTLVDVASVGIAHRSYACSLSGGAALLAGQAASGNDALQVNLNLPVGGAVHCAVTIPAGAATTGAPLRYGGYVRLKASQLDASSIDNEHATIFALASPRGASVQDGNRAQGDACTSDAQCQSAACVDGVCCNGRCNDTCMACDVAGSLGTCTLLDNEASHGARVGCGPYICRLGQCVADCAQSSDCVPAYHCARPNTAAAGRCEADVGICRGDSDCPSGRYCTPAGSCESPATQDAKVPAWRIGGGCGGGAMGLQGSALGLLPAFVWHRRRRRARGPGGRAGGLWGGVLLLMATAATPARAASPLAINLERLQLLGGRNDLFGVASPRIARQTIESHAMVDVQYLNRPLTLASQQVTHAGQPMVAHMGVLELSGGTMLSRGIEIDAVLPVLFLQSVAAAFFSSHTAQPQRTFGIGDVRLTPKYNILTRRRVHLGVAVPIGIPTGHGGRFLSVGGVTVAPRILLEGRLPLRLTLLLNAGYIARPRRQVLGTQIQDGVAVSAAVAWVLPKQARAFTLLASAWSEIAAGPATHAPTAVEILAGLRVRLLDQWSMELDYGVPMTSAPGLGRGRGVVALRFHERAARPLPPQNTIEPLVMPVEAVPGGTKAPAKAPPRPLEGPPFRAPPPLPPLAMPRPPPLAAPAPPALEQGNAFDEDDALPLLVAPKLKAKPAADRDGDGLDDAHDPCPDVAGVMGGAAPGCPSSVEAANAALAARPIHYVVVKQFATFSTEAETVMEQVRQIVSAYPSSDVMITGHVPAVGPMSDAQRGHLSAQRAEGVARWLALHGVASERMHIDGKGSSMPVDNSATLAGLARNRRISVQLIAPPAARP